MSERLVHFSAKPVERVYSVKQEPPESPMSYYTKPRGLWVSVEGNGDGWSDWCESESFGISPTPHKVTLAPGANILFLRSATDIDTFGAEFGRCSDHHLFRNEPTIIWHDVAAAYSGIIITPYQWSRRLHTGSSWYYGWDCASGCIWDAAAIERIAVLEPAES